MPGSLAESTSTPETEDTTEPTKSCRRIRDHGLSLRRYAHLSPEHLSLYADRLRGVGVVNEHADGTNATER